MKNLIVYMKTVKFAKSLETKTKTNCWISTRKTLQSYSSFRSQRMALVTQNMVPTFNWPFYTFRRFVYNKRKEKIIEKIFKIWISTFGCINKFLLDNGGEFDNEHSISLSKNLNIRICTTATESPWSKGSLNDTMSFWAIL